MRPFHSEAAKYLEPDEYYEYECEECGNPISHGTLCKECIREFRDEERWEAMRDGSFDRYSRFD